MSKVDKYLSKLAKPVNKIEDLNNDQVRELLALGVKDFKEERISLDELTDLCEILWSEEYHQKNKIVGDSINLVQAGIDLQYYLRKVENEESANIFIQNLRTLLGLYSK